MAKEPETPIPHPYPKRQMLLGQAMEEVGLKHGDLGLVRMGREDQKAARIALSKPPVPKSFTS